MASLAASRLSPRHWIYLDEGRTHEVHAQVDPRPDESMFLVTEFPRGSRDPAEAVQQARRVGEEAELQAAVRELEDRLRLAGSYWRADAKDLAWAPLGASAKQVDLRALEMPLPGATNPAHKMQFHHFHNPNGSDKLLVAMPRLDVPGDRQILAELAFEFPRVEIGELDIVHPRLAPATLRSAIVREHLELPQKGFGKLVEAKDYVKSFGDGWIESAKQMWRGAAARMLSGRPQEPLPTYQRPQRPQRVEEIREALGHAKILALKARFLVGEEGSRAVANGEHAIRRLIQAKRRQTDHTVAYELAMLETALLLEQALRNEVWSLFEEEQTKLLRYVRGFA
ncbi:MAG: hypothetical protein QOE90_455 [Thermoplasmata archaeon]|jgi:hypothetical protein|nr:hypothetical protein [Thermoplasmata archaeon]